MITVITTILNEAKNLDVWFEAMRNQEFRPDEIVVVDGGSTDGSLDIVARWASQEWGGSLIIPLRDPSCNIQHYPSPVARGRNIAASYAHGDILVVTDVGSVPERGWLLNLVYPIWHDPKVDVTYGICLPPDRHTSRFGEAANRVLYRNTVNRSSRNMAIRRKAWEFIGGYPEVWLTAEDTLFNERITARGLVVADAPRAIVRWSPPASPRPFMRQMYRYSKGDAICWTHTWMHVKLIAKYAIPLAIIPWYPIVGIPTLLGGFLYGLKGLGFRPTTWMVKLLYDIAHVAGFVAGLLQPVKRLRVRRIAGRVVFLGRRVREYVTYIQALMLLDLWLQNRDVPWLYALIVGTVFSIAIALFDKWAILRNDLEVNLTSNPEWQRRITAIEATLDSIKNRLERDPNH